MEEMNFTIVNENGIEVKCDVLSIINDDNDKTYIIYTDYTLNENNEYNVFVSQIINEGENYKLEKVEDPSLISGFQEVYEEVKKKLSLNSN